MALKFKSKFSWKFLEGNLTHTYKHTHTHTHTHTQNAHTHTHTHTQYYLLK